MIDFDELFKLFDQFQAEKAHFIGQMGESVVAEFAQENLSKDYYLIHNIVLKSNTGTTQIDQIIVSPFGLFVVEIKNHKGWIWGDVNSPQWTQTLRSGKYPFQNPLRQNYKHIKALQELLGYPAHYFKSLIAFSGQAQFRTPFPDNVVSDGEDYLHFIEKYQTVLLSSEQIAFTIDAILKHRLTDEEHQVYIEKVKQQYQNADENNPPPCPRCGNKMVLRKSKSPHSDNQPFWGCSRYPNCKAIVNIKKPQEVMFEIIALEDFFK